MSLQQLLDDDHEPGNDRENVLSYSEREDIETALLLLGHMDLVFRVLHTREINKGSAPCQISE